MIKTFSCGETQKVYEGRNGKCVPRNLLKVARRKLLIINAAAEFNDLNVPPGNKLHKLKGKMKNYWAIWINDQYRLCFKYEGNDCYDVHIIDYHD